VLDKYLGRDDDLNALMRNKYNADLNGVYSASNPPPVYNPQPQFLARGDQGTVEILHPSSNQHNTP